MQKDKVVFPRPDHDLKRDPDEEFLTQVKVFSVARNVETGELQVVGFRH
jgi:hypothetical protein